MHGHCRHSLHAYVGLQAAQSCPADRISPPASFPFCLLPRKRLTLELQEKQKLRQRVRYLEAQAAAAIAAGVHTEKELRTRVEQLEQLSTLSGESWAVIQSQLEAENRELRQELEAAMVSHANLLSWPPLLAVQGGSTPASAPRTRSCAASNILTHPPTHSLTRASVSLSSPLCLSTA